MSYTKNTSYKSKQLDIRVIVLDSKFRVLDEISGLTISASISIDSDSDVRRSGQISMIPYHVFNKYQYADDFDINANYKVGDAVKYFNNIYICTDYSVITTSSPKDAKTTGIFPTDSKYWTKYNNTKTAYWSSGNPYWFDKYIIIDIGEGYNGGEINWKRQGYFMINSPTLNYDSANNTLSFDVVDLMCKITGVRNGYLSGGTYQIPAGNKITSAIQSVLKEQGFTRMYIETPSVNEVPADITIDAGGTSYELLDELRNINSNYEMFFDVNGIFHFQQIPSGENETPIILENEWDNVVKSCEITTSFEDTKNFIEVYGKTPDVDQIADNVQTTYNTTGKYFETVAYLPYSYDNYLLDSSTIEDYSDTTTYEFGSEVKYLGGYYRCTNTNIVAGINPSNTDYWTPYIPTALWFVYINIGDINIATETFPIKHKYLTLYDKDGVLIGTVYCNFPYINETYIIEIDVGVAGILNLSYLGFSQFKAVAFENNPESPFYVGEDGARYTTKGKGVATINTNFQNIGEATLETILSESGTGFDDLHTVILDASNLITIPSSGTASWNIKFKYNNEPVNFTNLSGVNCRFKFKTYDASTNLTTIYAQNIENFEMHIGDRFSISDDDTLTASFYITNISLENNTDGSYVYQYVITGKLDSYSTEFLTAISDDTTREAMPTYWDLTGCITFIRYINRVGIKPSSSTTIYYATLDNNLSFDFANTYAGLQLTYSTYVMKANLVYMQLPNELMSSPNQYVYSYNNIVFPNQIRYALSGDDYDNIYSNSLAEQRAKYELYLNCRRNDNITLDIIPIYDLDVNQLVEYKLPYNDTADEWLIKTIDTDLRADGTQSMTLMKYYSLYPSTSTKSSIGNIESILPLHYIMFSAESSFNLSLQGDSQCWDGTVYYSFDSKIWNEYSVNQTLTGTHIYMAGLNNTTFYGNSCYIESDEGDIEVTVTGQLSALLDYSILQDGLYPTMGNRCFQDFFSFNDAIISADIIDIPSTSPHCYHSMFAVCISLTSLPSLPALSLSEYCYCEMFNGCTVRSADNVELKAVNVPSHAYDGMFMGSSIQTFPKIDAQIIGDFGCYNMFRNCVGLTSVSDLSFTVIGVRGCSGMFASCKGLTTLPEFLYPHIVKKYGCSEMFANCTNATSTPKLSIADNTILAYGYEEMFFGCTKLTTVQPIIEDGMYVDLYEGCFKGMFSNCTALSDVSNIITGVVTNLAESCFENMFYQCNNLAIAFDMYKITSATIPTKAFSRMFYQCTSLMTSPSLSKFTTILNRGCYQMFYGCTNLTIIPMLNPTLLDDYGCYLMFYGCTNIVMCKEATSTIRYSYRIPQSGETIPYSVSSTDNMFGNTSTLSTVTTPSVNVTYYTSNQIH